MATSRILARDSVCAHLSDPECVHRGARRSERVSVSTPNVLKSGYAPPKEISDANLELRFQKVLEVDGGDVWLSDPNDFVAYLLNR